jgi:hypothetical protein
MPEGWLIQFALELSIRTDIFQIDAMSVVRTFGTDLGII